MVVIVIVTFVVVMLVIIPGVRMVVMFVSVRHRSMTLSCLRFKLQVHMCHGDAGDRDGDQKPHHKKQRAYDVYDYYDRK